MKKEYVQISGIPSILWGNASDKLYMFVHGQGGCKDEAETFAEIAVNYEWQVLSIDLPEHGARKEESTTFDPWHVVPELCQVMSYARSRWGQIALRANSIGAWFSMLSFAGEPVRQSLFVSPVLNMNLLIENMMIWTGVTEDQLEKEKIIPTNFGQTLSWEYLTYVRANPIEKWDGPTKILYPGKDNLTDHQTVEAFADRFGCDLSVMENGEHWFHTPEQLAVLEKWTKTALEKDKHRGSE